MPLNFSSEDPEEPGGRETTIVSAFTADAWGGTDDDEETDGRGHMGWWCIDTPDAYRGTTPAYQSLEHELRKGIGDAAYERMAELLAALDAPALPDAGPAREQRPAGDRADRRGALPRLRPQRRIT